MIIALVGESGSGKTTLANYVSSKECENANLKKVVTYTTRPKRALEVDGVDYYFINDYQFKRMIVDDFVEFNCYRGWEYGTKINFDDGDDKVVILTPAGVRNLKVYLKNHPEIKEKVLVVYLCVDRSSRLIKILERGDDIDEGYRRNLTEVGQFDSFDKECDYILFNENYRKTIKSMASDLLKIIRINKVKDR
ncbi:MAG TPA: hypothetical protein OIL97_04010 [Oscillospiraceae bacterium]|nr:hypothetical protein [Oscillospiraceae bacterium]